MSKSDLDIVIPVYNEGENILDLFRAFERYVKTSFRVFICYDFDEVPARWLMREKGISRFNFKKWFPHYARWFFYALGTTYTRKGPEMVTLKSGAKDLREDS